MLPTRAALPLNSTGAALPVAAGFLSERGKAGDEKGKRVGYKQGNDKAENARLCGSQEKRPPPPPRHPLPTVML